MVVHDTETCARGDTAMRTDVPTPVPTPETEAAGRLAPASTPPQVMGPPIPGERGIAGIAAHRLRPFALARTLQSMWSNRDRIVYSWRILSESVCEGCVLGPRGLRDDVLP